MDSEFQESVKGAKTETPLDIGLDKYLKCMSFWGSFQAERLVLER